jgi:hypothetical protein
MFAGNAMGSAPHTTRTDHSLTSIRLGIDGGRYLPMPTGKGGFTKLRLWIDTNSQHVWVPKLKTVASGKSAHVNGLLEGTKGKTPGLKRRCALQLGEKMKRCIYWMTGQTRLTWRFDIRQPYLSPQVFAFIWPLVNTKPTSGSARQRCEPTRLRGRWNEVLSA